MLNEHNPLLAKLKLPGRVLQLPSRGLLYSNGELDSSITAGELHIQPMNAFDEVVLKNPDMLFTGKALDPVFSNCIQGIIKPTELFGKDVDAIMLFLRLVTYGPSYEITANHRCENGRQHTYTIDLEQVLSTIKYLDSTILENQFVVRLENGQIVKLQPARYDKIIEVLQANEGKEKLSVEDIQNNIFMNLMSVIQSIDGIEDRNLISEWIRSAGANHIDRIAGYLDDINNWGLDLTSTLVCRDCGEKFDVELPLNPISFFS
jgi:hypothetical protein